MDSINMKMDEVGSYLKGIYNTYAERLLSYGMVLCHDKGLVEDALHDTYLDLYRNRESFFNAKDPRKYLFAALRYKILRLMKERPVSYEYDKAVEVSEHLTAEETLIQKEQLRMQQTLTKEIIQGLTPRQREVLFLRLEERMSFQEIAEQLYIERQSAQNLFGRAIAKMRKMVLSESIDRLP